MTAEPAADQVGDNTEKFVKEKEQGDLDRRVTELMEMLQDQHAQSAVGQGEAPVGSGYQRVVA